VKSLQLLAFLLVALTAVACGLVGGGEEGTLKRRFQQTDGELRQVIEAAQRNDMERAASIFDQGPHAFLPTLDLPLRNRGEEDLGNRVHRLTNELEAELAGPRRSPLVVQHARDILALLPRASEVMGAPYSR
jgi:hypothetical protein